MDVQTADLVLENIGQLLTMDPASGGPGDEEHDPVAGLGLILDGALAAQGDRLVWAGRQRDLGSHVACTPGARRVDLGGRVALPGLVDCHTHLVFAGSRANEFARRVGGSSYEEILAAGGGIHATVKATREASPEQLLALGLKRLDRFLGFGVTTLEAKSGYGLDTDTELKILRVASELGEAHPVDVVPTFLGAHVVPREHRHAREGYLDLVCQEMLPRVAEEGLARFCDVFCDQGAFSLPEARRVLEAGLALGLRPKLHGEQLARTGAVELAIELGALSVDHLEHADAAAAVKLAASGTAAVLLPGATYFLGRKDYADGRMLADAGCRVAVSTDFNPGSCLTENLPLMLNMACLQNRLYPREAILGATRFAAEALGLGEEAGSLAPGRLADVLVLDTTDYRNLIYHFGVNHTHLVFKRGKQAWPPPG
ncbi:MAG TPA: imidazolonepropionase [Myxococcota bacterium]|nr:imidazolonepropionase [Myxococcota bacterium]HRY93937.1 imidazolonepropionase [Myxococcota bacterium]HSA23255.1 imidazolonepropionase [Myxococcota bacterium]